MRKWALVVLLVSVALFASGCSAAPSSEDGIVHLVFFYSDYCSHCHEVMEDVLPPLEEKYGEQLDILFVETSQRPEDYEVYLAAVDQFDVPPERQGVPALYIGKTHLVGSAEIPQQLEGLIEQGLEQNGLAFPEIPGLESLLEVRTQESAAAGTEVGGLSIHVAYFLQAGCQDCDRVKGDLNYLQSKFPQMVVDEFDVRENAALAEWMGERVGVPALHRMTAPTVFIGDDYLLEEELDARSLETLLEDYTAAGSERFWTDWEESAGGEAGKSIVDRFDALGVFTIVLAGLLDGLNPCAFATLVFFVSYLTISGRKGREILYVGVAFTFGVFLAYMLVGIGFYNVLELLGDLLATLGRWVYGLTAVFCLVLAVVSFLDYFKARRGDIGDMSLNLPHKLRMRINATIRKSRGSRAFVAGAFVTGIVVSFLELACTGQVYLPTILFVMGMPELRARAVLFLFIYNLLFILPLVVVFVLSYYGTGAKRFSQFLQERAATVKLGMSVLFLALGIWLLSTLL